MKSKKNKSKKQTKKTKSRQMIKDSYRLIWSPVSIAIVIVPLIVRSVSYKNILEEYFWGGGNISNQKDIFLIAKGWGIYFAAILSLFFLLCMVLLGRKLSLHSFWMSLPLCYLAFAFLSSVLSVDRRIAFGGSQDLHQPFPILAGYVVLFYYTYLIAGRILEEQTANRLYVFFLRSVLVLSYLLGLVGVLQLSGNDPFSWNFVQILCGLQNTEIINSGRIYMTLYHPDYVGVMTSMLIPVISAGIILEKEHIRYLYGGADILLVICLLSSQTRSGILSFLVVGVIAWVVFLWNIIRKGDGNYRRYSFFFCFLFVLILGILLTKNPLSNRFFRYMEKHEYPLTGITGIETGKESSRIRFNGEDYFFSWDDYAEPDMSKTGGDRIHFLLCDESERKQLSKQFKKKKIGTDISESECYYADGLDSLYLIQILMVSSPDMAMETYALYDGTDIWLIGKETDDDGYFLMTRNNVFAESVISEDAFPYEFYGFASDRGYIWSKTIAKLKTVTLIGTGPDTFPLFFPNNDYVSRHLMGEDDTIINKPHNWYLQMSSETGLLSAMVIVIYLIYFLWNTIKTESSYALLPQEGSLHEKRDSYSRIMNAGVGLSILSYMIAALANDSMLVCAPVFWVVLGFGSALHRTRL